MKRIFPLLTACMLLINSVSFSQDNSPMVKAKKLHEAFAYHEAIEQYQKVLIKEPLNENALRGIAECYRMNNDNENAEQYYSRLVKHENATNTDKYYYAQTLMYNAKYAEAKKYLADYTSTTSMDERAKKSLDAINHLDDFFVDSAKTRIHKLPVNSDKADFSPVYYNDGVVFVSSREAGGKDKKHTWTGNSYLTIFQSKGEENNLRSPEVFARDMESKYNDGPVWFNKDGNEMYLTRNNKSVASKSDKVAKLKIVHMKLTNGQWSDAVDLPFVSSKYNCAHACLSADGNRLYFASDMPGGYGGMDLYYSEKTKTGWDSPVNLGSKINSKGNELFPFVNADTTLYYASNGLGGLGGLDVYECLYSDGNWSEPRNMGFPLNTNKDDFGLVLDKDGEKGYLSSSRSGGSGDDDIYFVRLFKNVIVSGTVTEKRSGNVIGNANVTLKDREGKVIDSVKTNADGYYEFELEFNKDYTLLAEKDGYSKETKPASTFNLETNKIVVNFVLDKIAVAVEGIVYDKESGDPIDASLVVLMDTNGKELNKVTTGADGYYYFELESDKKYKVKGAKEGYFAKSEDVSTMGKKSGTIKKDLPLEKLILNKAIRLDNIYYDLAKWNIRKDAAKELDKLVQILVDNPTIVIELSSHTDCRASDAYNMNLSDKRAKSAASYIVKQGIAADRITGKGYGESMLINRCANGVKCSEAEHQENRRTEFKVLKY